MKNADSLHFFAYCRKSSEDSQRQVASIGDQIASLAELAKRENIELTRPPFTEERSAKEPGRPVFNEMLERIEKGEANGLLCWDIDRLYRNAKDEGSLRWLLQQGVIRVIKTPMRTFYPYDAGLLMGVEGGRATDYVIQLSKNVKRGLNSKALRGWRPSGGPIGYLNVGTEKGNKTIASDPERFHLVRRIWDLFLTGSYSVSSIRKMATEEWGLRTLQRRKIGGKPLSMSHLYKLLGDSFYYGYYPWTDPETGEERMIKGNHEPMITEAEYWRAQMLLGKKGKPQPKTREFAFTGLIKCGECGGSITAEEKFQLICDCKYKFAYANRSDCPKCKTAISEIKNPKYLHYVYYHCIKKQHPECTQKHIRLEEIEEQFKAELAKMTIDQDYLNLALEYLHDKQGDFGQEEVAMRVSLEKEYDSCQTRLKNLHAAYISPQNSNHELYSSQEFAKEKKAILTEREGIEKQLDSVRDKLDCSLSATERTFNFCRFALHHFNSGDLKKKRAIFSTIGSNITLKDKKLTIERVHPFLLIENELIAQRKLAEKFEPKKDKALKGKEAVLVASSPDWLREQDSNLQPTP